jgi:hypothetical protein
MVELLSGNLRIILLSVKDSDDGRYAHRKDDPSQHNQVAYHLYASEQPHVVEDDVGGCLR